MCATTLMPDSLRGQERSVVDPLELELENPAPILCKGSRRT